MTFKIKTGVLLLGILLVLTACARSGGQPTASPPLGGQSAAQSVPPGGDSITGPPADPEKLIVRFFAVGKADSILVQQGDAAMLIDGGTEDQGLDIARYLNEAGVHGLDWTVVTHSDSDHVGGVEQILRLFKTSSFMMPIMDDSDKDYQRLIKAVNDKGLEITKPQPGSTFQLGQAQVTVLAPNRDDYETPDNFSVVLRMVFGETSFLFTGDAMEQSETEMLTRGYELSSTVLKVGHHGQNDASSTAFLNAVRPKAAVISDAAEDGAAKKVLQRLADVGADVYRTGQAGTVIATSDGQTVTFNVVPSPPEKKKDKKK